MNETEKKLELGDFFYVLKKHIVVEAIILSACLIIGLIAGVMTPKYYVASVDLLIDAEIESGVTTEASLAKYYVPTVCMSVKNSNIINVATMDLGEKCSSSAITVTSEDDSLIISVSYKDSSPESSKEKLKAVVSALKDFYENGALERKKIKINPLYASYESDGVTKSPVVTEGSKKKTVFLLFAVLGVAAVFVYALCVYFIADKISSVDRIESVSGLKNFGSVTKKKTNKKESQNPEEFVDLYLTKIADAVIYDNLCTQNKIFQIQSCVSGEGKTVVTTNLAVSLAKSNKKVLIIDCDFSHPTVHRVFSLHRHVGITDYFKGKKKFEDITKKTTYGVDVVTCGDRIENHTIFFTSDKFKELLEQAKSKYDFILFDCAPVKFSSDYINVSPLVDATILVVGNEKINSNDLYHTVEELKSSNAKLIGTVFNFAEESKNKNHYYYYKNNIQDSE